MKVDKSLQEVWNWKEKVYEEMKGLSTKEKIVSFKKSAENFSMKYGLKLKKLYSLQK
ncbi:MAG: hypothetical protein AB1414_15835 [bacterium]